MKQCPTYVLLPGIGRILFSSWEHAAKTVQYWERKKYIESYYGEYYRLTPPTKFIFLP